MTKQYPIIMQGFSIVGLKKQYDYDQKCGEILSTFPDSSMETPTETLFYDKYKSKYPTSVSKIGCKTETRRLTGLKEINKNPNEWMLYDFQEVDENGEIRFQKMDGMKILDRKTVRCPYGVKGDELWVREKWGVGCRPHPINGWVDGVEYAADQLLIDDGDDLPLYESDIDISKYNQGWKSPLFMPKAASRITLEITGISVERLQDITEEGALREGVLPLEEGLGRLGYWDKWKDIHGEENCLLNPWLWVIQFKVKEFKQ